MNPFFIVGLPRSRTAWLANFLSYGSAFCFHDAIRNGPVPEQLERFKAQFPGIRHVGNSDHGMLLFWRETTERYPQSRWVIVHRPVRDALESFISFFSTHRYPGIPPLKDRKAVEDVFWMLETKKMALWTQLPSNQTLAVNFDELDRLSVGEGIWSFCVPDEPFNAVRWRMLNEFRVNVCPEKIKVNVEHLKERLWASQQQS